MTSLWRHHSSKPWAPHLDGSVGCGLGSDSCCFNFCDQMWNGWTWVAVWCQAGRTSQKSVNNWRNWNDWCWGLSLCVSVCVCKYEHNRPFKISSACFFCLLSFNRLSLTSGPLVHCQAFCRLKVLSLISCDLTWPQVKHKHTHAPYPHPDDHKQLSYNSYPNSKLTIILFLTLN